MCCKMKRFLALFFCVLLCAGMESYACRKKVTPQQFGAFADGIHDDTQAIQNALDRGNTVVFKLGVYKTTRKLIVHSNNHLQGEPGAVIQPTNDSFVLFNENSQKKAQQRDRNITVDGLTIDASLVEAQSEYSAGIYFCGVENVCIKNCRILKTGGDGIYLGVSPNRQLNKNVKITNCVFEGCGRSKANPRQSIAVIAGTDVVIEGCTMTNERNQAYAVDFEPNYPDEGGDLIIRNCIINGSGISCGGNKEAQKRVEIIGCNIDSRRCSTSSIAFNKVYGSIRNSTLMAAESNNAINIIASPLVEVYGNTIGSGSAAMLVTAKSDKCKIRNNKISSCKYGVYVITADDIEVRRNEISEVTDKGIYSRIDSRRIVVKNNTISTLGGHDIYMLEGDDSVVEENTCFSEKGAYVSGDRTKIRNNTARSAVRHKGENIIIKQNRTIL